jgi:predicted nucleic acid-binding Zn ribbon protein
MTIEGRLFDEVLCSNQSQECLKKVRKPHSNPELVTNNKQQTMETTYNC